MDGQRVDPGSAAAEHRKQRGSRIGAPGLADSLKDRTQRLHRQAERSGIIADILHGTVSRTGYVLLLRNLHPVYGALERSLEQGKADPVISGLAEPVVYRAEGLARDLDALFGATWRSVLPVLPAADRYARRIEAVAESDPARLLGHAYTRYLGDLNGGRVLRRLLARNLGLQPGCLSFYDFTEVGDLDRFRGAYRERINRAPLPPLRFRAAVDEGVRAFRDSIAMSLAVRAAAP
ncbi:heme oxygenase (biliverdin-producing) [Pelagibius sp.]|uniref:biliverdin-producing heme oxygenase n=1 Tax=Pelagibius sp. TaxID=1931238 RepID=UPI003B508A17